MFDKEKMKIDIKMMQERHDEKEQILLIISMMEKVFEQGRFFEKGYQQGSLDECCTNSYGGPTLGGFHGEN
jgi:hypothetical protein